MNEHITKFILDLPLNRLSHDSNLQSVLSTATFPLHITTPNPEQLIQAQSDPEFRDILQRADISLPDGIGIIWAIKVLSIKYLVLSIFSTNYKRKLKEIKQWENLHRITGVDALLELCQLAQENDWKVGLLGGYKGVASQATAKLKAQFSRLKIWSSEGHKDIKQTIYLLPYATQQTSDNSKLNPQDKEIIKQLEQENQHLIDTITNQKIALLFVAYGAPYQEKWIARYLKRMPTLKVAMGVGGALDMISGRVHRAPNWIRSLGFEWLYRLVQEPWRWRRQLRLVQFGWRVITG